MCEKCVKRHSDRLPFRAWAIKRLARGGTFSTAHRDGHSVITYQPRMGGPAAYWTIEPPHGYTVTGDNGQPVRKMISA